MGNREHASHDPTGYRRPGGSHGARSGDRSGALGGFTLVEILIVVVILGIMATIVIPQFSNASLQARENTLKDELRYLRVQVQVFKAQHKDVAPGYPGGDRNAVPTETDFVDQMTKHTSDRCAVNADATNVFKYGPYLTQVPVNPLTGKSKVTIVTGMGAIPTPTTDDGWVYQPDTQKIFANMTGQDSTGVKYADY